MRLQAFNPDKSATHRRRAAAGTITGILVLAAVTAAVPLAPSERAPDGAARAAAMDIAGFGRAVAVGESDIFVGEPSSFRDPGTVHVFRRTSNGLWTETAGLRASDATVGDGFGQIVGTFGSALVVGQPMADDRNGALYVFSRDSDSGGWSQTGRVTASSDLGRSMLGRTIAVGASGVLAGAPAYANGVGGVVSYRISGGALVEEGFVMASDTTSGDGFGSAIALDGNMAVIGAPGSGDGAGAAYVFERGSSGSWTQVAHLTVDDMPGSRLGSNVALGDGRAYASLPGVNEGNGAVAVFTRNDAGGWTLTRVLEPQEDGRRLRFGSALEASGDQVWIGVPGANDGAGTVEVHTVDGERAQSIADGEFDADDGFGGALSVRDGVAIVAAAGDAYGEGAATVFEMTPAVGWMKKQLVYNEAEPLDAVLGSQIDCTDGEAAGYSCTNVDLVSFVPMKDIETARGVRLNDVWGWTDPETGIEYALVGTMEETVFLELSTPENPRFLGKLPKTEGARGNTWRDIKTYRNHAFIVADGAGPHGMQVFDLTQLRDVQNPPVTFEATALYDQIHSSHNIIINEDTGFAYTVGNSSGGETCGGGLHMIDIRDPLNPTFVGCFADPNTGGGTGASHDAQCVLYHGPDTEHRGKEICIGSNGNAISVADVTDKANPIAISHRGYPTSAYVHQGWLTDDHRYFYQNDEADELSGNVDRTRTLVWDFSDLDDPILVTEFFGPTNATDHNLYVDGNFMYETNNASGLRVIDITDRENPVEFGHFDTTPYGTDDAGFNGTWSSYPYFDSGMIVVSSRREGVFIVKRRDPGL